MTSEQVSTTPYDPQWIRVKGKAVRLRKAVLGFVVVTAFVLPLLLLQWGAGPLGGSTKALLIIGLGGMLAATVLMFYRLALLATDGDRDALGSGQGREPGANGHAERRADLWFAAASSLLSLGAILAVFLDTTVAPLVLSVGAAGITVVTGAVYAARFSFSHERQGPTEPQYRPRQAPARPAYSIACSGGGIRSAAFCLGALQRLRRRDDDAEPSLYERADTVYGVSGGGYIATALHAARTYSEQGARDVFGLGSPEEDRLRRTSRYLAATMKERTLGLLSLLFGLTINVLLVVASLGLLAWWMAWWLRRSEAMAAYETWFPDRSWTDLDAEAGDVLPVVDAAVRWDDLIPWSGDGGDTASELRIWEPEVWLWAPISLAGLGILGFVVLKFLLKWVHGRQEGRPGTEGGTSFALSSDWDRRIRLLQRLIPPVFWAGVVAAVLLLGTPLAVGTISSATVKNEPTPAVAGLTAELGFASPDACGQAARRSFRVARQRAIDTGGETFSYGACGKSAENVSVDLGWPACEKAGPARDSAPVDPPSATDPTGNVDGAQTASAADCAETVKAFVNGQVGGAPLSSLAGSLVAFFTALTAIIGSIMKGPKPADTTRLARLRAWAGTRLVPWVGTVLVVVAVSVTYLRFTFDLTVNDPRDGPPFYDRTSWLWIAAAVLLAPRLLTDATTSSMHPFYRRRLAETFLLKRTRSGQTEPLPYNEPQLLSESRPEGMQGPGLVLCAAVNISDPEYIPTQRECAPFRFASAGPTRSPEMGLSDTWRLPGGMRDASAFEEAADPYRREATIAAAMAISGAAVAPRTGRANHKSRPYRLLLALANARLGVWLPNPYWVTEESSGGARPDPDAQGTHQRGTRGRRLAVFVQSYFQKPGPFRLAAEAFGSATIYSQRLYVTDGGHYDNTALVEALRDDPEKLIVIDASNDPEDSYYALADAVTTARMDLGIDVRLDMEPLSTDENGRSERAWTTGTAVPTGEPEDRQVTEILVIKASLFKDLPPDLEMYKQRHPEFPRTSTGDQLYGEYDFEAYRRLGYEATDRALASGRPRGAATFT